jgi:hypothetical protein
MAHNNTIFAQLLKLISRHEFESLAKAHHEGQKLRKMNRWSQFVALTLGQLSQRISLRDICNNLMAQSNKLYHLGCVDVSRSSLSRINEKQPYTLYEALFHRLLGRCQSKAPGHKFRFKNKLISLDATTIDLCLSVFPWADFRRTKGGIKLHVGLDHNGYLPQFVQVSEARKHEVTIARCLNFPKGSIVVFDRGYVDYAWYQQLNNKGVFFVTRLKSNADYRVTERRQVDKSQGLRSDQTIRLTGFYANKHCDIALRRISYRDPDTGRYYEFLTNNFYLSAKTIAEIYKARWQIEIFFKWIKQNLKIKTFLGTSKNAVLTQIWIAMCAYLLLAFIKFSSKLDISLQSMTRLLQLNLFERSALLDLFSPKPNPPNSEIYQLELAGL